VAGVVVAGALVVVVGVALLLVVGVADREPAATSGRGATQAPMTMTTAARAAIALAAVVRG
jgi:hypothetical protein